MQLKPNTKVFNPSSLNGVCAMMQSVLLQGFWLCSVSGSRSVECSVSGSRSVEVVLYETTTCVWVT